MLRSSSLSRPRKLALIRATGSAFPAQRTAGQKSLGLLHPGQGSRLTGIAHKDVEQRLPVGRPRAPRILHEGAEVVSDRFHHEGELVVTGDPAVVAEIVGDLQDQIGVFPVQLFGQDPVRVEEDEYGPYVPGRDGAQDPRAKAGTSLLARIPSRGPPRWPRDYTINFSPP
jgi:hypothetical protein